MGQTKTTSTLSEQVRELVRADFHPHYGQLQFQGNPLWKRFNDIGSELWFDTGSIQDAETLWTREYSALTTNNTLLNREVESGQYDDLIKDAAAMLADFHLSPHEQILEIAFILNARHALRLVEKFDAFVSVEEHTDLAFDLDLAVSHARRYHEICPERFIVKIPFTPAGLLATHRLAYEGVPINHTLGFSARQNYVIGLIGRPRYVNVFLGRLNTFVVDNRLGDGQYVGEKATLASQAAIRELGETRGVPSRQIAASFRQSQQVGDLAGVDVLTIPPKVARQFLDLNLRPEQIRDTTRRVYVPGVTDENARICGLSSLWDVDDKLVAATEQLLGEDLDAMTGDQLVDFFQARGCGDFMVRWSDEQVAASYREGKIPKLENWRQPLESGQIGLDALMNLAGFNSFRADQRAMDDRVKRVLGMMD